MHQTLALVPGLPRFDLPFAFTIIPWIGRSTVFSLVLRSRVLLWTQTEGKNGGGLGTRLTRHFDHSILWFYWWWMLESGVLIKEPIMPSPSCTDLFSFPALLAFVGCHKYHTPRCLSDYLLMLFLSLIPRLLFICKKWSGNETSCFCTHSCEVFKQEMFSS